MEILSRKMITAFALMLAFLFTTFPSEAAKKTVAVMNMENVSGYNTANVAQIMTEQLMVVIQNSRQYGVIERSQMGNVMKEQGFQNITSSNSVDMGNFSNPDYIVVGKITMATTAPNQTKTLLDALFKNESGKSSSLNNLANSRKAKIEFDVRFVDGKTGDIVFAKTFTGSKSGQNDAMALSGACKEAAERFLKELQNINPFMARIADMSGDMIYIDQGSESGLNVGDRLIVAREGEPIIIKGKIVDMKREIVCKARVVEVNADYSICKAEKPNAIRKGDIVRRDTK